MSVDVGFFWIVIEKQLTLLWQEPYAAQLWDTFCLVWIVWMFHITIEIFTISKNNKKK